MLIKTLSVRNLGFAGGTPGSTQTALKGPSSSAKVVTSLDALEELAGITPADNIIIADNDTELAELLKQEGF